MLKVKRGRLYWIYQYGGYQVPDQKK
eukprot:SAG22_NODE_10513_length_530_cov_1.651972_1_plen_25_part_10